MRMSSFLKVDFLTKNTLIWNEVDGKRETFLSDSIPIIMSSRSSSILSQREQQRLQYEGWKKGWLLSSRLKLNRSSCELIHRKLSIRHVVVKDCRSATVEPQRPLQSLVEGGRSRFVCSRVAEISLCVCVYYVTYSALICDDVKRETAWQRWKVQQLLQ